MSNFPPCPASLKQIQHHLTIAKEHETRDVVVTYWCRLFALQEGLKIDKSSPEARKLLGALMGWLETAKSTHKDNEAISHDIPAQAHLENYALKLFLHADQQDRAGVFNKNVVKTFFTSSLIYSVLATFGELTEEVVKNQKYAKWKATYIHNCLKNGETPISGPIDGGDDDEFNMEFNVPPQNSDVNTAAGSSGFGGFPTQTGPGYPTAGFSGPAAGPYIPSVSQPPAPINPLPMNIPPDVPEPAVSAPSTGVAPSPELITKAQKYCKFATSALNYDDIPTAVINLQKALSLLTTGREE